MRETSIAWGTGTWTTRPADVRTAGDDLVVTAAEASDYWRRTYYGFHHDSGHALLAPWPDDRAVEVSFRASDLTDLYDQAGLMLWVDDARWIKAGVEINDGVPHVGAVVTAQNSDWSLSPVPEWAGEIVTIRATYAVDAVLLRARAGASPWRTIRVAPFPAEGRQAGPFTCAPTRAGLTVAFTRWVATSPDADLHTDPPTA